MSQLFLFLKPSFNFILDDHSTNNLSAVKPIKATHKPIINPFPPSLKDKALKILDQIISGKKPTPGSYKGRLNSEPENNRKTLLDVKNA